MQEKQTKKQTIPGHVKVVAPIQARNPELKERHQNLEDKAKIVGADVAGAALWRHLAE